MSLPINAHLKRLICHQEGTGWRKTEPYLWTIFFKIDGEQVSLSKEFELKGEAFFKFSEGSHGNLGIESVNSGETIHIPLDVGLFETTLRPIEVPFFNYEIPGIIGVVAVLMEKENVSKAGAEAGHKALNDYVQKAVNQAIRDFDVKIIDVENIQESIRKYFQAKVESFVDGIELAVEEAVKQAQNIFQNIWALIDKDDLIGYQIWDINQQELLQNNKSLPLQKRWVSDELGDWELIGDIQADSNHQTIEVNID
ncbi:MAG: hypothetical protein MRZ79_01360 [Bacteroidia bacterium]|nr:hypothetical protein [Bacteroidia bacterium]